MSALYFLLSIALVAGQQLNVSPPVEEEFVCPERDGFYMDPYQCDKYYECELGIPYPALCEDGKVFDEFKGRAGHVDPCDTPLVVDCTDRPRLQPPTLPSPNCPRLHGTFADQKVCDKYYNCIDGYATAVKCTTGLHFSEESGNCVWPDAALRTDCVEENSCIGTFCCGDNAKNVIDANGQSIPHPTFANENDCQKFYICLNGVEPQESSCNLGDTYDPVTGICGIPEPNSPCEGYYANHPKFAHYYEYEDGSQLDVDVQDIAG